MYEGISIWDFSTHETEDLKEAQELIGRLGELGFPTLPDDAIIELGHEINRR